MSIRRDAVTGAFGFTGRALAAGLLGRGREVVTLARRTDLSDPIAARIAIRPLDFARPDRIAEALEGVDTLFNTYWLRFERGRSTFERAIANTRILLDAARSAGVRRVVHVSVVNASLDAPTLYFRAKAALEGDVKSSGISWAIVRPTLTFGPDDILLNNQAWALRRLPVLGIAGDGRYTVQPIHVADVAQICIEASDAPPETTVDAAGPEVIEYRAMVSIVRRAVRSRSVVVPMPIPVVLAAAQLLGAIVRDVVLTRDELTELTSSLLTSGQPPLGTTGFSDWVPANAESLGRRWASELARNYRTITATPS
jgi:NADH dehydrogenase